MKTSCLLAGFITVASIYGSLGQDRLPDPTWLHRSVTEVKQQPSDLTTSTCRYRPVFGAGDSESRIPRGIVRYGELTVDPKGASGIVSYPGEEQIYFVLEGDGLLQYGGETAPIRRDDFMYLPPGVRHGVSNPAESRPCRLMIMGFRVSGRDTGETPDHLMLANLADVPKQTVANHPPSTLFQLMLGTTQSRRDKLAVSQVVTSLFLMEFEPGGTNVPHHHDREEEIYLVLDGQGDMVAGGGMDGIEGRHPARAGDAYFFRLNCTVGFYSRTQPGQPKARILAVRSLYPFPQR
jgi:mannose-6-phosphate isomerase-like protein (cupin superfamily)